MRALMPWRPFRELSTLHEEIDDLFARVFGEETRWPMRPIEGRLMPAVESFVKGGELVVRVDLPGIDPKHVELAIEGDRLHIKGEREEKTERKERDYLHREVSYGRFDRMVALPPGVEADTIKAAYHEGVLEVTMKAPKTMTSKKVPITVA